MAPSNFRSEGVHVSERVPCKGVNHFVTELPPPSSNFPGLLEDFVALCALLSRNAAMATKYDTWWELQGRYFSIKEYGLMPFWLSAADNFVYQLRYRS